MKKFVALLLCALLFASLAFSVYAEETAVELTKDDISLDKDWQFGADGDDFLMKNYNQGTTDCWWYYNGDFTAYNSLRITVRMSPTDTYDGINMMFAYIIGENGNGYCFEYYPRRGSFDISYNDSERICESEPYYFFEDGEEITATCVLDGSLAAIIVNDEVVCYTPLENLDCGQKYPTLKGWSWNCNSEVLKCELVNAEYDIMGDVEEQPEHTQPPLDTEYIPETIAPETEAPATTSAPETEAETKAAEAKSGCGSAVALTPLAVIAVLGAGFIGKKKQ